ncbi:endonuclease/exonuclease/phosphatase family protein [Dysgonomonas termitidis]|uniref:Endonuclease/exonuclease/phosphatase domain-containing protein n=1 Tax=Dysgonomonas termitidis TaxID=1516126 RepID=A0ABV9KZD2_9BACT
MSRLNKFRKILQGIILLLIISIQANAQENFRIMFYNVENMYDIKDNPGTNDDDLTPSGQLHWTNRRYWKKLNDIGTVIASAGDKYPPALVGICEVENDSVLFDLTKRAGLRKHKYEYIITNSKDNRGSNTALLYQRDQIKIISKRSYTPTLQSDPMKTTRDILHVTGRVINDEILDIFVCHFPSRREGIKRTRPDRIRCAELLRQKTDSLFRIRKKANIIIMGDFNDYPNDISLSESLGAHSIKSPVSDKNLYNMFYHYSGEKNAGSYKYRGKWNFIDQFIISGNLLNLSSKISIKGKEAHVYPASFLLHDDNKKYGGQKPFRTYSGFKYLGGYSDHLPVYMDLIIKN